MNTSTPASDQPRSSSFANRIAGTLGLNTILGRFLFSAIVLAVATVSVAWISDAKVSRATKANTDNLSERDTISHRLSELGDQLWQAHAQFQSDMLVPSDSLQESVLQKIDKIDAGMRALRTCSISFP